MFSIALGNEGEKIIMKKKENIFSKFGTSTKGATTKISNGLVV
jgi:hypothetical protein